MGAPGRVAGAIAVVAIALGVTAAATFAAVETVAVPLFLDASVPSTGRGGASTAVFWDDGPNYWANPALLAFHRGIRYERSDTQRVPDLTDDVLHRVHRWTFGAYGIGVAASGRPIGKMGSQKLDYGTSEATDASGVVIGSFSSYEEWSVLGVGVSVGELLASVAPDVEVLGSPLARYVDMAGGFVEKQYDSFLAPAFAGLEEGRGDATVRDWGFLVRVTPVNSIDHPDSPPGLGGAVPLRVDVSFGHAVINFNDATMQYVDSGAENPIARMPRTGWGFHGAVGAPASMRRNDSAGVAWLARLVDPLVRIGYARDTHRYEVAAREGLPAHEGSKIRRTGWEITFANVFTIRRGDVEDPDGDIVGDTDGWSVGLRAGRYGGFRYDEATHPQATGLANVHRDGWSVFVDPIAIWEASKRGE